MNLSQKSLQISCSEFGMISKPVVVGGKERYRVRNELLV